jgi:hypothetical protein
MLVRQHEKNTMAEKIEIKPFEPQDGMKYKFIQITDIALHTDKRRLTEFVGKKIEQSFCDKKPDRIYAPIDQVKMRDDHSFDLNLLAMDEDFVRMVQEEEAKGFKIVLQFPKTGIPVFPGSDTVKFMQSKNGKRILRKLAKENDKS